LVTAIFLPDFHDVERKRTEILAEKLGEASNASSPKV
jgi:hypothetical protein